MSQEEAVERTALNQTRQDGHALAQRPGTFAQHMGNSTFKNCFFLITSNICLTKKQNSAVFKITLVLSGTFAKI